MRRSLRGFIRLPLRGDIEDRADVSQELAIRAEARSRHHEDLPIFAARVHQPVFEPIPLATGFGSSTRQQHRFTILGMNGVHPSRTNSRLLRLSREGIPGLAEKGAAPFGISHPYHHWSMIRHIAKERFAPP